MDAASLITKDRSLDLTTARQAMIGGTDIAPILGISERKTRFAVWASKVHANVKEDTANEEEAGAGTYYEPFILQRFAQRFGVHVEPTPYTYCRKGAPFLGANPDGLVCPRSDMAPIGGVDAKTRSPFQRGAWGDTGTSDVPADELCQAQWYMEILDLPIWYLAVFFDRVLSVFVIPRDRELGALAVQEATAFWNEYVLPRKEPPFEGPLAADYLRRKFPHATDPIKDAEPEDDILVARRDLIRRHITVLKARLDIVEGALKSRIAAAPGIQGTGYLARWSESKAKRTVSWKSVVTQLRSFPVVADEEAARQVRAAIDEAIARFTTESEGSRSLRVYFRGPNNLPPVELEPIHALPPAPTEEGE